MIDGNVKLLMSTIGIAVVFAIVLGILIDHVLRWWHKRLGRHDAEVVDEWLDGGTAPEPAAAVPAPLVASADVEAGRK